MEATQKITKPRINSVFKHLMSIHWWMAGLYLVLFVTGGIMARLPRSIAVRSALFDFHKSIAVLAMAILTWRILVLLRVWGRKYAKRLPKFTPEWLRVTALHVTLYIFMWAVPVSGFFLSNSFKAGNVKFFGILLPDLFPQNSAAVNLGRSLHFWLGYTFLAAIVLHMLNQRKVMKALWRRFIGFVQARKASLT